MNIKVQALESLVESPKFHWKSPYGTTDLEWTDERTQPTEAEIQAEVDRLQTEYDNNQYQRDRQYPPIGDQLDMIYHAGLGGDEFQAAIKAVKDAHPKP